MKVKDPLFIIYVHNMERAVTFYRDTFTLELMQHTPGWSMFRFGGSTIALHIILPDSNENTIAHAGISFQVDDLEQGIKEVITAGGQHIVTREADGFVPVRMCELKDTEGNGFELRQFVRAQADLTAVEPDHQKG